MVNIRERLTLRAYRITAGIKAQEIALTVGVTTDTVYKWERGKSFPNAPQMIKILELFAAKGYVIDINDINFFSQ